MRKLIRDKVAANMLQENIHACGDPECDHSAHPCVYGLDRPHHVYQIDTDFEYARELAIKLSEEFRELIGATSPESVLEEAADCLEVLTSIVATNGYSLKDLLRAQHTKKQLRGGFENRYVLVRDDS